LITIDSKIWHENNINLYLDNCDDEMLAINILFKKNIDFKDAIFKLASKIKRSPNLPILVLKNEYGDEKNYTSDRIFNDYWDSIQISEEDLNKVKIFIKDLKIKAAEAEMKQAAVEREEIMLAEAERGKNKLVAEAEMKQAAVEREKRKLVAIQEFCWTIPGLSEINNNTNHSETSKERLVDNVKKLKFFSSITLEDIREKCMLNHDLDIDSGRKTLTTLEDCEQYWHQYSKFIPQQWDYFFKEHEKIIADTCSKTVQIVDYGCGQGLATLKLLDKFFKNDKTQILDITLIEKSTLTLLLAKIFLSAHSPEIDLARVKSINKEVDNISTDYFESDPKAVTIHLFSNILDMGVVVPDKLLIKINKFKGKHLFLMVSQGGNWNNGLSKFEDFCEHLYMPKYKFKAIEPRIPAEQFTIQATTKEMNVISSMALMEVIE
jgi:hypothetical protein